MNTPKTFRQIRQWPPKLLLTALDMASDNQLHTLPLGESEVLGRVDPAAFIEDVRKELEYRKFLPVEDKVR